MFNVCYKVKNGNTFLAYVSYNSLENLTKEIETLNREKPEKDACWNVIDWNNVVEYFISGVNTWVNAGGLD